MDSYSHGLPYLLLGDYGGRRESHRCTAPIPAD